MGKNYLADQAQESLLGLTHAVNAADGVALVLTMTSSEQEQIDEFVEDITSAMTVRR